MKAGILRAPNDLVFGEVPTPILEPGDLLLRVRAATVCGTDLRILRGTKTTGVRYPSVLGHEFAGEIVDTAGGTAFQNGQRVVANPAIPCGFCASCKAGHENLCERLVAIGYELDGAFAEYIRIPARALAAGNVREIPATLSFEEAALAEPLACVLNGQQRVGLRAGDDVAVLGCGPIGLLHVKLAHLSGARRIFVSEHNLARRQAALEAGADVVIDPRASDPAAIIGAETAGGGVDVAVVAIGAPRLADLALSVAKRRGRVSLFAGFPTGERPPLDLNLIHYRELVVTGASGLGRAAFDAALDLLASGRIDVKPFLGARFGLPEIGHALAVAESKTALKVAIVGDGSAAGADGPGSV